MVFVGLISWLQPFMFGVGAVIVALTGFARVPTRRVMPAGR